MMSRLSLSVFDTDQEPSVMAMDDSELLQSMHELMEGWRLTALPEPIDNISDQVKEEVKEEKTIASLLELEDKDQLFEHHLGAVGSRKSNAILIDSSPVRLEPYWQSSALVRWQPHPLLAPDLVPIIQRQIDRIPQAHLEPPVDGEQYNEPLDCYNRLLDYAFSQGFWIVTESSTETRRRWICVHHGQKTRDYRGLGEERLRWSKSIGARACPWRVYLLYRHNSSRSNKAWFITVKSLEHSHKLAPLPTVYQGHEDRLPETQQAIAQAYQLRLTGESFKTAYRQLQRFELSINRKKYYNLVRGATSEGANSPDSLINALLGTIHEAQFVYEARWHYEEDPWTGKAVKSTLQQVVFFLNQMQAFGRRFGSDFAIQIDATFNTNRANLLLGVVTGISNTGRSFPLAYSLQKAEDKESWQFLIDVLCRYHFKERKPKVVVSDRGEGLIAALPESPLYQATQQLCQWHIAENIKKRIHQGAARAARAVKVDAKANQAEMAKKSANLAKSAQLPGDADTAVTSTSAKTGHYDVVQVSGEFEEGQKTSLSKRQVKNKPQKQGNQEILVTKESNQPHEARSRRQGYTSDERAAALSLIWPYIESATETELKVNRGALKDALIADDCRYFETHIQQQEQRFIGCYVRKLPNLGVNSTQRGESGNRGVKAYTEPQYSLEQMVLGVKQYCQSKFEQLPAEELKAYRGNPLLSLGASTGDCFAKLHGVLTVYAIEQLVKVFYKTVEFLKEAPDEPISTGYCSECDEPARFGLPCKHMILPHVLQRSPIPIGIVHPRWILHNDPLASFEWQPLYTDQVVLPTSLPERLTAEDRLVAVCVRFIDFFRIQAAPIREQIAKDFEAFEQVKLPQYKEIVDRQLLAKEQPFEVKTKKKWTKPVKTHGKANRRLQTTAEKAQKDADKEIRETQKEIEQLQAVQHEISALAAVEEVDIQEGDAKQSVFAQIEPAMGRRKRKQVDYRALASGR